MDTKFDDFESIDIDWYFLDRNFTIASVASGGGKLPMFVFNSMERHQILQDYFNNSGFIGDFSIKYKFINRIWGQSRRTCDAVALLRPSRILRSMMYPQPLPSPQINKKNIAL